jgi:hypothetical protein
MTVHLDIELSQGTATVFAEKPGIEFGVPGPQGPKGDGGSAGAAASQITVTPTGDIASTNVQAALVELDTEKPDYAYVKAHGVYIDPEPPADPTEWGLWVDSS